MFTPTELHSFKKNHLETNQNTYGIPQGSPISSVYANIYLKDFDLAMNRLCQANHGLYRRYCDDFVVIVPYDTIRNLNLIESIYQHISEIPALELQPDKTQIFHFLNSSVLSENERYLDGCQNGTNQISFLGFTFDGHHIRIRSKTIAKIYERMYLKADYILSTENKSDLKKTISRRNIYRLYSYKGKKTDLKNKKRGNFLSYVDRAQIVFGPSEPISRDTNHAWDKFQKRLRRKRSLPKQHADQ